ncbi:ATP-grasp domain-containing protein [Pectobacterium parvum]|uniref:ATP-grasp domain-containing protein n=1 Tax=Pectobacterium parvum TaxID=2778550 RepID=A0AAP9LDB9_9GAMM|nr:MULTISPECIES: ATP-grasp domain-containing protein [Pectobacterium]MCU1802112.1 ATP-grasp domain-containing protein [Pectobacterium parvum]QHQ25213.1 ATP-grasp domain-containing protein [Pectobacterium parvum]UFK40728.1 ATP-grasp domain-containing protein [Pectobacterium parvum]GKW42585.1 hypothetical protein PEC301879_24430 [Pectobacterium carotovorum subsp. carotovorum]
MNNTIILFGCASFRQGPRAVEQARSIGLYPILVDTRENLDRLNSKLRLGIEQYAIPDKTYGASLPIIEQLSALHTLIGIYTFEEYSVQTCSLLCERFRLPTSPSDAVATIRNKYQCRRRLQEAGLPQPAAGVFASIEEAHDFIMRSEGDSWIVKPLDAAGSLGVRRIERHDFHQLEQAFASLTPDQQTCFIVEQFITGKEYSIEGYFCGGSPCYLGVTEKHLRAGEYFVEDMHVFPAPITDVQRAAILHHASQALKATGLTFGHFHIECWLINGTDVMMGEIHNRPGGDYIHLLTELCSGVETYRVVFEQYVHSAVKPLTVQYHRAAVVKYFDAPPGVLGEIVGLDDVAANLYLTEVSVSRGDRIVPCHESSHRIGCVVATGADTLEALSTAKENMAHVVFNMV